MTSRRTAVRGALGLAVAASGATGGLLAGCAGGPAAPLTLGVAADEPAGRDRFATTLGAPVGIYSWYVGWADRPGFDAGRADAAVAAGALPMLTWEPWSPSRPIDQQPDFALARILEGDFDDYLASFARQIRDWGGTLALRFAHELDAPHYPWSVGLNGNTAEQAVAAWHKVRGVVAAAGADVVWVWCANVHAAGTVPYQWVYPGDDAVDWVALDGYNGGDVLPWGGWRSPSEVFGQSLEDIRALSDRPVVIGETGCAEEGGDKGEWIEELFDYAADAGIRGVVWFDYAKETDWRATSSPAALAGFRAAAAVADRWGPPPLPARFTPR